MNAEIPWVAVIVATVANIVLGFLWYGPIFGKQWAAAAGVDMEGAQPNPAIYAVPALSSLLGAIVLYHVMVAFKSTGVAGGLQSAVWMWIGFQALTSLTNAVFRASSFKLWAIESLAHLVGFALSGVILGLMA